MRRLPRILLNVVTLLSLVLCAATVALWVLSQARGDGMSYEWVIDAGPPARVASISVSGFRDGVIVRADGMTFDRHASRWRELTDTGIRHWSDDPGPMAKYQYGFEMWGDSRRVRWGFVHKDGGYTEVRPAPDGADPPAPDATDVVVRYRWVGLPWWFVVACFALAPAIAVGRRLRAGRRRLGLCAACGYDLRATPGRCPECGTVSTQPA